MYEVRGLTLTGEKESKTRWVVMEAGTLSEAVAKAAENGMYEVYAAHLSKVMEVFDNGGGKWYKATVREQVAEEGGTGRRAQAAPAYDIIIRDESVEGATAYAMRQIAQGYDFELSGVREVRLDGVI